jgi:hypothetical protein
MRRARRALLAVVLVAVAGCASAPPTPVTTIDPLVGKWRGTVSVGRAVDFIDLTIYPDRTLIAIWRSFTSRGTITISGGQASYQMAPPIQEGTFKLYTGQGKPQLYMESLSSDFYATLQPDS